MKYYQFGIFFFHFLTDEEAASQQVYNCSSDDILLSVWSTQAFTSFINQMKTSHTLICVQQIHCIIVMCK